MSDFIGILSSKLLPGYYLAQDGGGATSAGTIQTFVLMGGIVLIFYFLLFRPQQKKQKALKLQIEGLSKGDRFVTAGGIYATVVSIKENIVTAKIATDVKVEIAKSSISAVVGKE